MHKDERVLRASAAAHASWANTRDPAGRTAPAREAARSALLDQFEREVDPDGDLPEAERARRAESARKAYFQKLALKSVRARRARRESGGGAT